RVLNVDACYFARGQYGMDLTDPADVELRNCAFGPHSVSLFALHHAERDDYSRPNAAGEDNGVVSSLKLQSCSAFMLGDSVFRLEEGISCRLQVENCILSCPEAEGGSARSSWATLIQQVGSKLIQLSYTNSHTMYQNLMAMRLRASSHQEAIIDWNAFKHHVEWAGDKQIEMARNPWAYQKPLPIV